MDRGRETSRRQPFHLRLSEERSMGRGRDSSRRQPFDVRFCEGHSMGRERETHNASRQRRVEQGHVVGPETESRPKSNVCEERMNFRYLEVMSRISKVGGNDFDLQLFDRSVCKFPAGAVPKQVRIYDLYICPLVHPVCNSGAMFAFALYADSKCLYDDENRTIQMSVGVYGTRDAFYNQGYRLPQRVPQMDRVAKIYSAIAAVKVARAIIKARRPHLGVCGCAPTVVLLVDSDEIALTMTHFNRTSRNRSIRVRGRPVEVVDALNRLGRDVRRLWEQQHHIVRFWKAPIKCVNGAHRMAVEALTGDNVYDETDADFDDMCIDFKTCFLQDERVHASPGAEPGCGFHSSDFPLRAHCAAK